MMDAGCALKRTYDEFLTAMESDGWHFLDGVSPHIITHNDPSIISTYTVKAGGYGKFMEIGCPPSTKHRSFVVAINGTKQIPLLHYYLSIRCRDDTNYELPDWTKISIFKTDYTTKPVPFTDIWLTYNQISQTRGSRFKREEEKYFFEMGHILLPMEKLVFSVYESDIDIVRTEARIMCDIFVREEAEK